MAGKPQKDDEWISWGLITILFAVGLSPIALILLFLKLFGGDEKKKQTAQTAGQSTSARQQAGKARAAVNKVTKSPAPKKSSALVLKIVGAALAAVGLLAMSEPIGALFWSSDWVRLWLEDFITALMFMLAGAGLAAGGFRMDRELKRYAKYLSVMGDRDSISVQELARTLGFSTRRVERDLQKMIDRGYFGGRAYLNVELGYLLRSGEAYEDLKCRQQAEREAKRAPEEVETGYSGLLRKIRYANDRIADPVLSAKIDRLEEITARIFKVVEADPAKKGRIDTFLNYYLPTTQKLLDSYAEFEAAGVEGENLRQAKQRIESTMDAIIRGFERQLDELYKADAMDVDSDIRVMETMLRRDTGKVSDDFDLGGTAAQKETQ